MKIAWNMQEVDIGVVSDFAGKLKISPVLAKVLWNRGIRDEETARRFLRSQLRDLGDPFQLDAMDSAVERIWKAFEKREKITLYGDYDVDGVTSVALMKRILDSLGAPTVSTFLPDRFEEGYGLTRAGVGRCLSLGKPDLLIVLDCGTNSKEEVECLSREGVDVIILDHHEPDQVSSPVALVNYKRVSEGDSKFKTDSEYCTAGLVFKVCHGLIKHARSKEHPQAREVDLKQYLDMVALATIADIAPLTGENRILAKHGLRQMEESRIPGIRALMKISRVGNRISGYDCGFKLGPRLNAAGRLESAMASLELLLTENEQHALQLAQQLDEVNRERQAEEARVLSEALEKVPPFLNDPSTRVLVLAQKGWHEGVVGIVASRISREFHMPTFVISLNENGEGKGSGRSLEGFNMAQAIDSTRSHLIRGGGHAMAAGVTLKEENLESWRSSLQEHAVRDQGQKERLKKIIRVDAELNLGEVTMSLAKELQLLEPCGTANVRPVFLSRRAEVSEPPKLLGSQGKHVKLRLRQGKSQVEAIGFGMGNRMIQKGDFLDLFYEIEINEYLGNQKVQLNLRELDQND